MLLTETCHRIAVVSEREQRKATRGDVYADGRSSRSVRLRRNACLDCSQQESSITPKREEGDQVRDHKLQSSMSGAVFTLWGRCDLRVLVLQ